LLADGGHFSKWPPIKEKDVCRDLKSEVRHIVTIDIE